MKQYTAEEKARLEKLGEKYLEKRTKFRTECYRKLPDDVKGLIGDHRNYYYEFNEGGALCRKMIAYLAESDGNKPSEFIEKHAPELFNGYINPKHKKHFYYTIDHVHERIYAHGWQRRSLRSKDPMIVANCVINTIHKFKEWDSIPDDICDYLEDKLTDEELGFKFHGRTLPYCFDDLAAAEIDFGNERLISLLTDCINGENDIPIDRLMFRAIVKSHDRSLYELLGRLLCAARLQEGLRQTICETMDEGAPEAFLYLLGIINENNFIRFSSVKRAVGVWLGFMTDESVKLDRISDKSIALITDCLSDTLKRDEYLNSEDSMKIHIALWSLGFYESRDLVDKIRDISKHGTRHQLLTASYSVDMLNNSELSHEVAKQVIPLYCTDTEMMAGYLGFFMRGITNRINLAVAGVGLAYRGLQGDKTDYSNRHYVDIEPYFSGITEAKQYYDHLKVICSSIKGRKQEFSPFVFPWFSNFVERGYAVLRMGYIASALRSNELIDEVCGMLGDADQHDRVRLLELLLAQPETEIQRRTLTASLCDKAEYTRKHAYEIVKACELSPENYLQMEEMLKYKAADARENLIKLLMKQDDNALYGSISRLIEDKKEEKRTAALDMIMNLSKDEKRAELYGKCKSLAKSMTAPTTKEKILLDSIFAADNVQSAEPAKPLYTDDDEYFPEIPDNELTRECVDTFMRYFPDSEVGSKLYPDRYRKGFFSQLRPGACDSCKQAEKDIKALCAFVKQHEKDEFINSRGESDIVGGEVAYFYTVDENRKCQLPLKELWTKWLNDNITEPERYLRMYVISNCWGGKDYNVDHVEAIYGKGYASWLPVEYQDHSTSILKMLINDYIPKNDIQQIAITICLWFACEVSKNELYYQYEEMNRKRHVCVMKLWQIQDMASRIDRTDAETVNIVFPLLHNLFFKHVISLNELNEKDNNVLDINRYPEFILPESQYIVYAAYNGLITEQQMYRLLFLPLQITETFSYITSVISVIREKGKTVSTRDRYNSVRNIVIRKFESGDDEKFWEYLSGVYNTIVAEVLNIELKRGDSQTDYSRYIKYINRIYGVENFTAILSALGNDTLERSTSYYISTESKKGALSRLLSVCIPNDGDNAEKLRELIKGTDITEKRLIEASLYSPEWIEIVGEYLGWEGYVSGCYYFMAHMNEYFDDKRKAVIARFTPLTDEELRLGAFDVEWFRSAYETLGQKRFDAIYDAAKYITDGTKHSRARKYADAVLGKLNVDETRKTVVDKRNKDLLMAYPLIPLNGEDDICERYLYLQLFLKESKKFGSQRSASEKAAVGIAMQNLATNAG